MTMPLKSYSLTRLYGNDFEILISGWLHSCNNMSITLIHKPTGTIVRCKEPFTRLKRGISWCEREMKKELLEANIATLG